MDDVSTRRGGALPVRSGTKTAILASEEMTTSSLTNATSPRSALSIMMQRETVQQQYQQRPAQTPTSASSSASFVLPYLETHDDTIPQEHSRSYHESHRYKSNHQPPIPRPSVRDSILSSSASYTQKNVRPPPKRPSADASFLRGLGKSSAAVNAHITSVAVPAPEDSLSAERGASLELPRNLPGSRLSPHHTPSVSPVGADAQHVVINAAVTVAADDAIAAATASISITQQQSLQQQSLQQLATSSKQHSSASSKFSSPSPLSVNTFHENEQSNSIHVKRMMITPSRLVRNRAFPFICASYIPYSTRKESSLDEDSSTSTPVSAVNGPGGHSSGTGQGTTSDNNSTDPTYKKCFPAVCQQDNYDPYFLDDPEIRGGKQKKVMVMKGMITSTIPFVKSSELKNDLNDQFKRKHQSWFNKKTELTLSMIRQVKSLMIETMDVAAGQVIEVSTVAIAFVFFEKLVLQNLVTKQNRKIVAATCLFLAFKFNSESGGSKRKTHLQWFFTEVEHHFGINKKAILQNEFETFAQLQFDLNVDPEQWLPHVAHIQRESGGKTESWCQAILLGAAQKHAQAAGEVAGNSM